ncbi:MAG: phage head-tail joining protein [Maricaulaceae bacterium]
MTDLALLKERRSKLAQLRASGIRTVVGDEGEVTYRSDEEFAAAIADLDRQIADQEGRSRSFINVRHQKGW